jgi:flagellar export protein FliJ
MSTLDSLIRVHRWQLDEQRRAVAELERLVATLRSDVQRLDAEHELEQDFASKTPEASFGYASYAGSVIERRRKRLLSLAEAEQRSTVARETLAEAFQEAKRYEIAAANRILHQRRVQERVDQGTMDELASNSHRRSENTDE